MHEHGFTAWRNPISGRDDRSWPCGNNGGNGSSRIFFFETDQESDLVERLRSLGQRQERIEAALGQVQEHLTRGTQDPDAK